MEILVINDFQLNYFKKLFGLLDTYQEEEFFTSFLAEMHKKLAGNTANKTNLLMSTTDLDQKMESIKKGFPCISHLCILFFLTLAQLKVCLTQSQCRLNRFHIFFL